ncbi:acyl-CoA dehydrogenase family protein [Actinophytocola gossypii]|uniref:Acyl-CoA/acyl-ACP dehydrogenase n=1 Tax=Actinophytocola gossypii TaxID=2812003 RepID=A0ABT2JKA8_9PSEU|nr:acyl-CoA dehydrogenase family protein [Actinophytocola gossypii]MCT2588314.1 acyl-CoA/acyl-ACP dehydrogenase [Actinophytocola gossypii]
MPEILPAEYDTLLAEHADTWDAAGELPHDLLRELGKRGLLCAQVPTVHGGLELDSGTNGELTAQVGARCSSTRSVMTSQGMAAWAIQRLGDPEQRATFLPDLVGGQLAAVAMTERDAGSDLSGVATEITLDGDTVLVTGAKRWTTAATYADLLVVFGRHDDGAAAVVVPTTAPGVTIEPVPTPLGCRAAGHAHVDLDRVRVPVRNVLGGGGPSLALLVTTALAYGRMSVAWGCVGILRACLRASTEHAARREQGGKPIAGHQLVARQLADLYVAERAATLACEHASARWDARSPDMVMAGVLAKYTSARHAAAAGATAVQILASWGAADSGPVARAFRDAKLMEIIEGTNETCQLLLAEHALTARSLP